MYCGYKRRLLLTQTLPLPSSSPSSSPSPSDMLMRLGNPRSIHPDLQQYTFASLAEKAAPPPPAGATQTTIHGGGAPDVMPGKTKSSPVNKYGCSIVNCLQTEYIHLQHSDSITMVRENKTWSVHNMFTHTELCLFFLVTPSLGRDGLVLWCRGVLVLWCCAQTPTWTRPAR